MSADSTAEVEVKVFVTEEWLRVQYFEEQSATSSGYILKLELILPLSILPVNCKWPVTTYLGTLFTLFFIVVWERERWT